MLFIVSATSKPKTKQLILNIKLKNQDLTSLLSHFKIWNFQLTFSPILKFGIFLPNCSLILKCEYLSVPLFILTACLQHICFLSFCLTSYAIHERRGQLLTNKNNYANDRLNKLERKLSSIEHRLSFIEERSGDIKHDREASPIDVHINDVVHKEGCSRSSSDSGIHQEGDDDDDDQDFIDRELNRRWAAEQYQLDLAQHPESHYSASRVETRPLQMADSETSGIHIRDKMSHDKSTVVAETMLKLLEAQSQLKHTVNTRKDCRTSKECTLGAPRKVRIKTRSPQKQMSYSPEKELAKIL